MIAWRRHHEIASKVVTGGKTGAATTNNSDAHFGISIIGLESDQQLGAHRGRDRISLLWSIQRDSTDPFAGRVESNCFKPRHVIAPECRECPRGQRRDSIPRRFLNE